MAKTFLVRIKGGPGSGNWGHAGRPGMVGGSGGGAAGAIGYGGALSLMSVKIAKEKGWKPGGTRKQEGTIAMKWQGRDGRGLTMEWDSENKVGEIRALSTSHKVTISNYIPTTREAVARMNKAHGKIWR